MLNSKQKKMVIFLLNLMMIQSKQWEQRIKEWKPCTKDIRMFKMWNQKIKHGNQAKEKKQREFIEQWMNYNLNSRNNMMW